MSTKPKNEPEDATESNLPEDDEVVVEKQSEVVELEQQYRPQLEKIVKNVFEGAEIGEVGWFGRGYNSVAFDVELKNPPKQVVVKIVEKEYSTDAREKERHVWELLKEKHPDFPVPEVYAIDTSKTVIDKSYSVLERIEGENLGQVWDDVPNKGEVFQEIGRLTGMIHAITYEEYGDLSPELELQEPFTDWQGKYDRKVEKIIDRLRKRDYVDDEFVDRQAEFWSRNRELMQSETSPVFCWGDVGMGNMLVRKKEDGDYEVSGLIDFEYAHSGGAVHDIFSRVRAFEHYYDNREQIFSRHQEYFPLPENYAELAQVYHWLASLGELSKVPSMSWHGLDDEKTEERKKIIIENNKKRVGEAIESFA